MAQKLSEFFEDYLEKKPIFSNKKALQANYTPKNVPYRQEQIKQIAGVLAPALKSEKPSNIFIYGKTGTGKTLTVQHIKENLIEIAEEKKIPLNIVYINCKLKKVADTEYRILAQLIREFNEEVPSTGLPTDDVYKQFIRIIDDKNQIIIIILDEIDQLVSKAGDEILYNLTRLNSELKNCQISIVGISNDLIFTDSIDPRVKSSLSEEELVFPPYNAIQLQKILLQRAKLSFNKESIKQGVIEKCAAYAAREHGDARRALELLRVAGELSERGNSTMVEVKHIDKAEEKIERDKVLDVVSTQPKQSQITLYSIFKIYTEEKKSIFTGDIYEIYKNTCKNVGLKPLTQRRISDIIAELDMLGIINAKVISKGRYGRTREVCLAIPSHTVPNLQKILVDGLGL